MCGVSTHAWSSGFLTLPGYEHSTTQHANASKRAHKPTHTRNRRKPRGGIRHLVNVESLETVQSMRFKLNNAKEHLRDAQAEHASLRKQLASLREEQQQAKKELRDMNAELDRLSQDAAAMVAELNAQIAAFHVQQQQVVATAKHATQQRQAAQAQLRMKDREIDEIADRWHAAEAERQRLQATIDKSARERNVSLGVNGVLAALFVIGYAARSDRKALERKRAARRARRTTEPSKHAAAATTTPEQATDAHVGRPIVAAAPGADVPDMTPVVQRNISVEWHDTHVVAHLPEHTANAKLAAFTQALGRHTLTLERTGKDRVELFGHKIPVRHLTTWLPLFIRDVENFPDVQTAYG